MKLPRPTACSKRLMIRAKCYRQCLRNSAWLFVAVQLCCAGQIPAEERVDFESQIAPIFEENCVRCHSETSRKGDVSLETKSDVAANSFVIDSDPENSALLDLVTSSDGEPPDMPREAKPLSEQDVKLLREWIRQGANWPEDVVVQERSKADTSWWSLQPLTSSDANTSQDIDDFVRKKLAENELTLNPPASRRSLIRRATYDLIGLPPTPEEVAAFVDDDRPGAYERLIDRLLASPHYGERWGRHWLDVVRFGESNGFERNVIINNLWPFRDYVIDSINQDKPFDQFIREHIAGDVLGDGRPDIAVGTAFLVAGPYDDVGNQDPKQMAQIRANTLDEIISATGQAFLGMTIGCARCHNHKFDPISQADYYSWYATFAGVRHGAVELATPEQIAERESRLGPLVEEQESLSQSLEELRDTILERGRSRLSEFQSAWTRDAVDRTGTEDRFESIEAKFVRLVCEAQDGDPDRPTGFGIDEFEVYATQQPNLNVALASNGGVASGDARKIEDFPGAYGPQLTIDGKFGARFLARGTTLTIELAEPTYINRVVFSSARGAEKPEQGKFTFVGEYRLETSANGNDWTVVASSGDRQPVPRDEFLNRRLRQLEITDAERVQEKQLKRQRAKVRAKIAEIPPVPKVWIGERVADDAKGPFHVFLGGSPQKLGKEVLPTSLSAFDASAKDPAPTDSQDASESYQLEANASESDRRAALANWLVHGNNPLTPRVLVNRIWHYHFGTGIVDTPSDFGYMGGRPTHPKLLDFLARKLQQNNWRIKPLHRLIMLSDTYRQSSAFREDAARVDGDARLLWRFPPRRLSAEEVRDTMLSVTGKLDLARGGPGFRLYHFMQDNVCTYVPLDHHGPETYRRAIYHQNARASVVDLMTEFDQPDCAFSAPKRAETTTPLQALTLLNHQFTLDMAKALADRLQREHGDIARQIEFAFQLCYNRSPTPAESKVCCQFASLHQLPALCRVLLNTSELIYIQ